MKYTNATYKRAFTLIEVLIVVAILGIMLTATYAPYSHYQKKALLKQGKKEIVQSIYEARNLAINGLEVGDKNVSVWLYIDTSNTLKNNLTYYSYDNLDTNFRPTAFPTEGTVNRVKQKDLPNHIWLDQIEWGDKFLFFFQAITWSGAYYSDETWSFLAIDEFNADGSTLNNVDIFISYKWANTPTLTWSIDYYTNTYIADY